MAADLRQQFAITAKVIVQDLTIPNAAAQIAATVATWDMTVDILVNNAGVGDYGAFSDGDRVRLLNMIQLNITALVDLTYHFLPGMQQRQSGSIINLSSIAGFQPLPYMSLYAATKAFVLSFSEAIWAENQQYNIQIVAACPGPTATAFFQEAQFPADWINGMPQQLADPATVVQAALDAVAANKPTVVSGDRLNRLIVNLPRCLPRSTLVRIMEKQFRPATTPTHKLS